jgi:hypothetical protein
MKIYDGREIVAFTQNPVGGKKFPYRSAILLARGIGLINLSAEEPNPMESIYKVIFLRTLVKAERGIF